MSLQEQLSAAQLEARKSGDKDTLSILQVLLSAIKNEQISKGSELNDEEVQAVIARQVKQLRDSKADFEGAGRDDLLAQVNKEIELLGAYLPKQLSDEELTQVVSSVIAEVGAESPQDMGRVMGPVMAQVQGKADGGRVKTIVTQLLSH